MMSLSGFDAESWNQLSEPEQIALCRHMAKQMHMLSSMGVRGHLYADLARNWGRLADELARRYYGRLA